MEKRPPGIYSCFFPLLPLLKHFVPGFSQLCRQTGSVPQGDVKSHLSSVCNALRLGAAAAQICPAEPSQVEQFTGHGCWPGGDVGTASTLGSPAAGSISPLRFSCLRSWGSCIALAQGKGRTGEQD